MYSISLITPQKHYSSVFSIFGWSIRDVFGIRKGFALLERELNSLGIYYRYSLHPSFSVSILMRRNMPDCYCGTMVYIWPCDPGCQDCESTASDPCAAGSIRIMWRSEANENWFYSHWRVRPQSLLRSNCCTCTRWGGPIQYILCRSYKYLESMLYCFDCQDAQSFKGKVKSVTLYQILLTLSLYTS